MRAVHESRNCCFSGEGKQKGMREEPLLSNSISNRAVKRNSSREESEGRCDSASLKYSGQDPLLFTPRP